MANAKNKEQVKTESGNPPNGEELDAFTNSASKKVKPETTPTKPQADETLNPDLTSQNDI
jgi:hypothetical protein